MTISHNTSAPLVVVAGATGLQGSSVIRALISSDKPYRIRGLTRNGAKPAAQVWADKGVEMVVVPSVTQENQAAVFGTFEGATFAFLVTNWVDHGEPTRQIGEAELMIDAAKAAGAKGVVWSGLFSVAALSGGKYTRAAQFETKAQVSEYGRQCGVPFVDIQAGGYASDFLTSKRPRRKAPESDIWISSFPMPPSAVIPIIDIERDYGLFVQRAIEAEVFPDGQTIAAWSEHLTLDEQMQQLSEVTGKKVVYQQSSPEEFKQRLRAAGAPVHLIDGMVELFTGIGEFGYYANDTVMSHEGLAQKTRSWREFAEAADWSGVFV